MIKISSSWVFCVVFIALFALPFINAEVKDGRRIRVHERDFSDHPCRRPCRVGSRPMVCEYLLELTWYTTMSRACFYCPNNLTDCERPGCILGSGTQRPVVVANLALPGPTIEVCLGDRIRVTVANAMQDGESTAIHWHGLHQRHSPYMDGVAWYTQCPIGDGTNFTYDFVAEQSGTHFWHSTTGTQRGDGVAGALIIRDPKDRLQSLYDKDDLRVLIIQDWCPYDTAFNVFADFNFGNGDYRAPLLLINGRLGTDGLVASANLTLAPFPVPVPPNVYVLDPKLRYRLRIINNAFLNTPIQISIAGHNMIVIASDGYLLRPVVTAKLTIMPGERYDVVPCFTGVDVSAKAIYRIQAIGLGASVSLPSARVFANIMYLGGKNPLPLTPKKATRGSAKIVLREVNYWDFTLYPDDIKIAVKIPQLRSVTNEPSVEGKPDVQLFAQVDFELVRDPKLFPTKIVRQGAPLISVNFPGRLITARINSITNARPPVPLLTQWDEFDEDLICNLKNRKCEPHEACRCVHLHSIRLGALVEIVLVANGFAETRLALVHPMHLHGYHFRVVAMATVHLNLTTAEVVALDKNGLIVRNLRYAPLKDTIGIPAGGYTVIRFRADNPGIWVLNTQIELESMFGAVLALRVGKDSDLPHLPPGFPSCSPAWTPPLHEKKMPVTKKTLKQKKKRESASSDEKTSSMGREPEIPDKGDDTLLDVLNDEPRVVQ